MNFHTNQLMVQNPSAESKCKVFIKSSDKHISKQLMKGKLVFACAAGFKILIFCYNMLLDAVVAV